jgi:hypothetical protein
MRPGGFIVGQSPVVRTAILRHHYVGQVQGLISAIAGTGIGTLVRPWHRRTGSI